jgi:hypothetical protein
VSLTADQTTMLDELEREIRSCTGDDVFALLIPYQDQPDYQVAIRHFDWCIAQLRKRGMRLKVSAVRKPDGLAMVVEQKRRK